MSILGMSAVSSTSAVQIQFVFFLIEICYFDLSPIRVVMDKPNGSHTLDVEYRREKSGSFCSIRSAPPVEPVRPGGVTGRFLCFDKRFFNILVLGFGFAFTFGPFMAVQQVQGVLLNSIQDEYYVGTSTGGYICAALGFVAMTVSFALAPGLSALAGPKLCMVVGSACVSIAMLAYIRPLDVTLYISALFQGTGAGICWTVYGHFLMENSTEDNVGRNTGIFWAIFQCGPILLNLYYFLLTRGVSNISTETRYMLFAVVVPCSVLGFLTLSLLQHPWTHETHHNNLDVALRPNLKKIAKKALRDEFRMSVSKNMLLLAPLFIHMGTSLTFYLGVFGTSMGYSQQYGDIRESLVGLNGVFVAVGQVTGGLVYMVLGPFLQRKGRDLGILLALIIDLLGFYTAFLALPERSPLEMTSALSPVPASPYLALSCSVLMGFGDAGWNNPLFALLGQLFQENPVAAFAVFQAYQAAGNVVAYAYSTALSVSYQLIILSVTAVVGAFGYFLVEWRLEASERTIIQAAKSRQRNVPSTEL